MPKKVPTRKKRTTKKRSAIHVPWKRPLSLVVHGLPGVGKTEFAAAFPSPYFIIDNNETGIHDLVDYGRIRKPIGIQEVDSFDHLMRIGEKVGTFHKLGVKTLAFDSMYGIEHLCFAKHCAEEYNNDWSDKGFFAFYKGPKSAAATLWKDFIDLLDMLVAEGISVILIAHTETKVYSNPTGSDHDRYIANMDKSTWQRIHRWASVVLYYGYHYDVVKEGTKGKARESVERQLYSEWSPAYDAKNRFGLEPNIDAGDSGEDAFKNFCKAFPKPRYSVT